MNKIIDYLAEIETSLTTQQLKSEKISFLLAKKKKHEEIETLRAEYQELLNQEISSEEKNLLHLEIEDLEKKQAQLIDQIKERLIGKEGTGQNILVEIRPGPGGTEAGLFARDLYRMYYKFAGKMG
jgi:peptide chain release factor 1